MYVIIRRRYAYLEQALRPALEGQANVKVIVDRRQGERRTVSRPVAIERRGADRRRPRDELIEVVIAE